MLSITDSMLASPVWREQDGADHHRHLRGRNHIESETGALCSVASIPSDPPYWNDMLRNSFRVGMGAARKSLAPAAWVWGLMAGIVALYYLVPVSHGAFSALIQTQERFGVLFSTLGMGLCVGIPVEIIRVLLTPDKRWSRSNTGNAIFNFFLWSFLGFTQHYRFGWQVEVFGAGNSIRELTSKVVFEQFIFIPLFVNPYQSILYLWKNHNYRWREVIRIATPFRTFWGTRMLPVLVSNWAVRIPMAFLVYLFPPDLQIPMQILAVTVWAILLTFITSATSRYES